MTAPGGGDINLATLWIPIVPETSHIGEAARRAGEEMKREFSYGFGSSEEFGGAIASGIGRGFQNADLPGMFNPVMSAISGKQALMIGVVAGAVTEGLNLVTRGVEGMFDMVVKAGEAVAKEVINIGLVFDEMNKSIILYTDSQMGQLSNLQGMAREVYGRLDVGTEKLGQNMAVLSKQFNLTEEQLKRLSWEITEAEGRFGGFDIRSLLASMHQFHVEGKDVSGVLQTIISDAREFGIRTEDLQSALVKTGPAFSEMGVSAYSASEAIAKMTQMGADPQAILRGIAHAATEMGKDGSARDLRDFTLETIRLIEQYDKMGEVGKKQAEELSNTVFGSRFYLQVLQQIEPLKEALEGLGNSVRGWPMEKVITDSRTVREEFTLLQHQLELFAQPLAEPILKGTQDAFKGIEEWFNEHHDQILEKIGQWGHALINALPEIQQFVADGIEFLGVFFNFAYKGFMGLIDAGGQLIELWGKIRGDEGDIRLGEHIMKEAERLGDFDWTKLSRALGEGIRGLDLGPLQRNLGEGLDKALEESMFEKHQLGHGLGRGGKGPELPVIAVPKDKDGKDINDPFAIIPGLTKDGITVPFKFSVPGEPGGGGGSGDQTPGQQHGGYWPTDPRFWGHLAITAPDWLNPPAMHPFSFAGPPGGGRSQQPYAPGVPGITVPPGMQPPGGSRVVVPGMPGIPGSVAPSAFLSGSYADLGSGGFDWDEVARAEASNNWANPDTGGTGHFGGLQFALATWNAFGGQQFATRPDLASREEQIIVANRTAFTGFGGTQPQGLGAWETITNGMARVGGIGGGMAAYNAGGGGGYMPAGMAGGGGYGGMDLGGLQQTIFSNPLTGQKTGEAGPYSGGGGPGGGGNQLVGPGTANPGYYSANWEAHTGHVHTSWTSSPDGEPYGLPADTVIGQGQPGFPQWVYDLGEQYGLIASTYAGHQVLSDGLQHGIDWWPAAGGTMYPGTTGYSQDQVSDLQDFASSMAMGGAMAGGGAGYSPAGMGTGGGVGGGSGGGGRVVLADFWGPGGGRGHGGGSGGAPHHGGGGRPGPSTPYDPYKVPLQLDRRQDAIDDANIAIGNLERDLARDEARLPLLEQKLQEARDAMVGMTPDDWRYPALNDKLVQAQTAVDDLKAAIDNLKGTRIPREYHKRDEAQMRAQEPLKGEGISGGGQYSAAEQLGAGFLSGIFSDLGMGNVLGGKTPDQWGIVKLLGGLAGYGVGLGNRLLGGAGGLPNVAGVLPGIAQGAANAVGLPNLPHIAQLAPTGPGPGPGHSGGPTVGGIVVAPGTDPGSQAHFGPGGPVTHDHSIHVAGNFKDNDGLIKHLSDTRNSRAAGYLTTPAVVTA